MYFACSTCFSPKIGAVYEIIWKNMLEPGRPQMTIKRSAKKMRIACRIAKAITQTQNHNVAHWCFITD